MMKTKFLLAAIALPLAFTACTDDVLVEAGNGQLANLESRATLGDVTFVAEGVDSRLALNGNQWTWENTDKFSAHLIDGQTAWTADTALVTNYIYSKTAEGYTTTSQMVEGLYWFYAPAKENKVDRNMMEFDLPTIQTYDAEDPEATILAQQVFFSPVYKMEAKNNDANVKVPLSMYNWYAVAEMAFENEGEETLTIDQIIVKTTNALAIKGKISPKSIADAWTLVYDNGQWVNKKKTDGTSANVAKPLSTNYVHANADAPHIEKAESNTVFFLDCNVDVAAGETFEACMLMPQGNAGTCTVTIVLDNGKVMNLKTAAMEFNHHAFKSLFGRNADGSLKTKAINKDEFAGSAPNYVMNNDEIIEVLNSTSKATVNLNMVGEWTVNAEALKAICDFTGPVTFDGNIDVALESTTDAALTLANLTNAFTLKSGKLAVAAHAKNITVEGGELTLTDGKSAKSTLAYAKITNNGGTITANDYITATAINNNKGTLKFAVDQEIDKVDNAGATPSEAEIAAAKIQSLTNGTYKEKSDGTVEYTVGKIVVNSGVKLTLNDNTNKANAFENTKMSELEINGQLVINEAYVAANPSANPATPAYGFINNGDVTVVGKITTKNASVEFQNNAKINASGVVSNVINDGEIITDAQSARITVGGGNGKVDNSYLAYVVANEGGPSGDAILADQDIYYSVTSAINQEGFKDLWSNIKGYNVNTLKFTAGVTLNEYLDHLEAPMTGISKLVFSTGSSLHLGKGTKQALDVTEIMIEDDVVFSGYDKVDTGVGFREGVTITVAKGKKLTLNYITLIAATDKTINFVLEYQTVDGYTTWGQVDNTEGDVQGGNGVVKMFNIDTPEVAAVTMTSDDIKPVAGTYNTANWIGALMGTSTMVIP